LAGIVDRITPTLSDMVNALTSRRATKEMKKSYARMILELSDVSISSLLCFFVSSSSALSRSDVSLAPYSDLMSWTDWAT